MITSGVALKLEKMKVTTLLHVIGDVVEKFDMFNLNNEEQKLYLKVL